MKAKYYISAFVLALLLVPGAAFVAQAQTSSSDDTDLAELVEKLTDRVETLEKDLQKAEVRIAELEKKVAGAKVKAEVKEKVKAKWNGDKFEKGDKKVCHAGQTLEVSGWAAAAHIIHHPGDFLGECNDGEDEDEDKDEDEDEEEEDEDEDEEEDDTE